MLPKTKQQSKTHHENNQNQPKCFSTRISHKTKLSNNSPKKQRDLKKIQFLMERNNNKQNMQKTLNFKQMKVSSIMANLPELHSPQLTIQFQSILRQKLRNVQNQIIDSEQSISKLPPLKNSHSCNYNPKSKNSISLHRQKILELQDWLKRKLENPPQNLEESMEYKDVIMAMGMEKIIKMIRNRCRQEGDMVATVWQITWAICREIMLYLSKRLRRCEKILEQQVDFFSKNFTKRINHLEGQNQTLAQQNKQLIDFRNKVSKELQKVKKKNKNLRIQKLSLKDMNAQLKENFQAVLKQNLLLHLKQQPVTQQKKKWVKRSYQSFIAYNDKPQTSRFKDYATQLIKTQISNDKEDIQYEPSIFQLTCNLNVLKQREQIRRSEIDKQLEQMHRQYDKMTQTIIIKTQDNEINTQSPQIIEIQLQTDSKQLMDKDINTIISYENTDWNKEKTGKKSALNTKKLKTTKQIKNKKDIKNQIKKNKTERQLINQNKKYISSYSKPVEDENSICVDMGNNAKQVSQTSNMNINNQIKQTQKPSIHKQIYNNTNKNIIDDDQNKTLNNLSNKMDNHSKIDNHTNYYKQQQYTIKIPSKTQYNKLSQQIQRNNVSDTESDQQQVNNKIMTDNGYNKQQDYQQKQILEQVLQEEGQQEHLLYLLQKKQQKIRYLQNQLKILQMKFEKFNDKNLRDNHFISISNSRRNSSQRMVNIVSKNRTQIKNDKNVKKLSNAYSTNQANQLYLRDYQNMDDFYTRKTEKVKLTSFQSIKYLGQEHNTSSLTSSRAEINLQQVEYSETCAKYFQKIKQQYLNSVSSKNNGKVSNNNQSQNRYILDQYRQIFKQSNKTSKQFNQKHSQNYLQKSLLPIIRDMFKQIQNSIKIDRLQELKVQYQLLPMIIMNRFNRMFGVKAVSNKHLKDLFACLSQNAKYNKKYDILMYFLTDQNNEHPLNIDLFFVYMVIQQNIDPFMTENKTLQNENYQYITEICKQYLSQDPQFIQLLQEKRKHLLENSDRSLINLFKSIITAYQKFYEQKTKNLHIIYRMLSWREPLNYSKFIRYLSGVNSEHPNFHQKIIQKLTNYCIEYKIFEKPINIMHYNRLIVQCSQFNAKIVDQSKFQHDQNVNIYKIQKYDRFTSKLMNFIQQDQNLTQEQLNFVKNYAQQYIIQSQTYKIIGILGHSIFDSRVNQFMVDAQMNQ